VIAADDLARLADASAEDVLAWTFAEFGARAAIVTAFQVEGMVVLDIAQRIAPDLRVITVDTGRLPQETYELIDAVRGRYGIEVEVLFPDARAVSAMVGRHGVNLFTRDEALRKLCCEVRKVWPLEPALEGLDAWVTGLRRGQSDARAQTPKVQTDAQHGGMLKVNPIADWSREQVWDYVAAQRVPVSALYEQGYTSIGCAPCTRAVAPGESERAGRWWWEAGDAKECGIHERTPSERLDEEVQWLKSQL
jgi:phosphoadenosine phosphosulfate reductase